MSTIATMPITASDIYATPAAQRRMRAVQLRIEKATDLAYAEPVNGLEDLRDENAVEVSATGRRFQADFIYGDLLFETRVSVREDVEGEIVDVAFAMVTGTHEDGARELADITDAVDFVNAWHERADFVPRRIPVLRRLLSQLRGR